MTSPQVEAIEAAWKRDSDEVYFLLKDAVEHRHVIEALHGALTRYQPREVHERFTQHLWRHHIQTLVLAVRKLQDRDDRTLSLRNLLASLQAKVCLLTRERYVGIWRRDLTRHVFEELESRAHGDFNRWVDPKKPDVVSEEMIRQARQELFDIAEPIQTFVNQVIAHHQIPDTRDNEPVLLTDVYAYFDSAWRLMRMCMLIIKARDVGQLPKAESWIEGAVADLVDQSKPWPEKPKP